jgi:Ca-activated chloride channel family protein
MIALILACLLGQQAAAVDSTPEVIVTQPDESKFPDIAVYFEVRRPDGTFVRDADRSSFRVEEDGKERPILDFDSPITVRSKPTTIVLVLDRSGSMRQDNKIDGMKRAVGSFVEGLPEGSRVAVIAFSSDIRLVCPFTTDKRRVLGAVEAIEASGATRYFDAVSAALKLLEEETGRRAVLAMTDGQDTESQLPIEAVIDEARRLNLPVNTLGLGEGGAIDLIPLERLAKGTRGQFYLARDAEALKAIYQELAERLGSAYSLVYQTERKVPDGTLRPIKVFYAEARAAGETAVFIRGMVVPEAGWSRLFVAIVSGLCIMALLPGIVGRRGKRLKSSPDLVDPGDTAS